MDMEYGRRLVLHGCFCRLLLLFISMFVSFTFIYIPVVQQNVGERDNLITTYFHLGFNYVEILSFLVLSHGIRLSIRQLKRILRNQGLFRRRNPSDPHEIVNAVERELRGSGSSIGYRLMHQLTQKRLWTCCRSRNCASHSRNTGP